jgi:transcription elongation factor GreB
MTQQNKNDDSDNSAFQGKNYMTPQGAKRLMDEFKKLKSVDRPEVVKIVEWAAGNGDRSENGDYIYGKRRLREIDRRLGYLSKRIDALEIVDPLKIKSEKVLFGATVSFRDENDIEKTFSIVGLDEADVSKNKVSWVSPIGKALLNTKVGDCVQFHSPKGVQELEVTAIEYLEIQE